MRPFDAGVPVAGARETRETARMTFRALLPAVAVLAAILIAFLANFALPHQVVHGLEAFAAAWSVYVVGRLAVRLSAREKVIQRMNAERESAERLAALTTLAAGAAHELATPLATIAVVASDLSRRKETAEDAALLTHEVSRCREILEQLSARAQRSESPATLEPRALLKVIQGRVPIRMQNRIDLVVEEGTPALTLPVDVIANAVAGLVKNGIEASDGHARVTLSVGVDDTGTQIVVEDRGAGMTPDLVARVGEPFLTTKEAGQGMGLGVFLARLVAQRLGGALLVESEVGRGTRILFDLPRAEAQA